MSSSEPLSRRVIELESAIAVLQHDFDQLNSVVLRQQSELEQLRQTLSHLETRLGDLSEDPEPRDPIDERPPHY